MAKGFYTLKISADSDFKIRHKKHKNKILCVFFQKRH